MTGPHAAFLGSLVFSWTAALVYGLLPLWALALAGLACVALIIVTDPGEGAGHEQEPSS